MLTLFVLFITVIISSGLCSMSEAALLSLPMIRARILNEQKHVGSADLLFLKENMSMAIASIVIVNNAINIIGSIFIGQQVALRFGNQWLGLASATLTFAIIVASEVIPKTIGERYKIKVSLASAKPLRWLVWILRPVVEFLAYLSRPFTLNYNLPKVTEEEIRLMLRLGRDAGTVEMDEELLCNRVFRLNDRRAFQIMKPIEDILALPADKTLGELRETLISARFSRLAVYDKDPKDFVGMVQHRVLLREIAKDNYNATVREFMTVPIFVNWFTKADELLQKFQAYHQHLFIVQDTHGKDVGLVTMEDVLEELFGEIYDEKDVQPKSAIAWQINAQEEQRLEDETFDLNIDHPNNPEEIQLDDKDVQQE
ncbi:MAG: hemolysin family protein [Candidatus Omnitrophota bacterium]